MDNIRTEKDTLTLLQSTRRKIEIPRLLVRIGESETHIRVVGIKFKRFYKSRYAACPYRPRCSLGLLAVHSFFWALV
jgi:hypothetical protein